MKPSDGAPALENPVNAADFLPIVYEDEEIWVVHKSSGLPSTGKTLSDPNCAQSLLAERVGRMPFAIHQLDQGTSGLLMFAKRKSALVQWQKKMANKSVRKIYWAWARGPMDAKGWQKIDAPLSYDDRLRRQRIHPTGKKALTHWRVLASSPTASLVELRLLTGRTHQIRVHLAHLGHPIFGDERYGGESYERLALHACRLRLPLVTEAIWLSAHVPPSLRKLSDAHGLSVPASDEGIESRAAT